MAMVTGTGNAVSTTRFTMLAKRIIPCLDVTDGRVVKGVNFGNLCDAGDPVERAILYNAQGADELTFLDITATSDNRATLVHIIEQVTQHCQMPVTVGGGIRSLKDMRQLLQAGADKISINTSALKQPDLVNQAFETLGSQCLVVAIDAKRQTDGGWKVYTHGGRNLVERCAIEWAQEVSNQGAGEILLTSMDSDGTKNGYDIKLTHAVSTSVPIPVIASGGAGNLEHLVEVLQKGKADAVLAASIFHFGEYTLKEAKQAIADAGLPVRL